MSQNETQLRVCVKRSRNLGSQVRQFVQSRGVGTCFVCDQRSTEFEEDQLLHGSVLPQTDMPSMGSIYACWGCCLSPDSR